jgi:predicted transcriptional regulator
LSKTTEIVQNASKDVKKVYTTDTQRETVLQTLPALPRFPYDEVRDWVQSRQNYFDLLDRAAESLFAARGFQPLFLREDLRRHLRDAHGITVSAAPGLLAEGMFWRLNRKAGQLYVTADTAPESEIFWLAHVIGQLEQQALIEAEIRRLDFSSDETRGLARMALANYFAGAADAALPALSRGGTGCSV